MPLMTFERRFAPLTAIGFESFSITASFTKGKKKPDSARPREIRQKSLNKSDRQSLGDMK